MIPGEEERLMQAMIEQADRVAKLCQQAQAKTQEVIAKIDEIEAKRAKRHAYEMEVIDAMIAICQQKPIKKDIEP